MKINNEDITDYSNYKWIKVPKYKMDENLSWEERYKQLEAHHIQETEFLIKTVRELSDKLNNILKEIPCSYIPNHNIDNLPKLVAGLVKDLGGASKIIDDIFCDHEYKSDGGSCTHCGKTVAESLYENKK